MSVRFLIAGVQRGGTSALWTFLRQHPNLCLSRGKELHFFDDETVDWERPPYDERYHVHFLDAKSGQLWGEATPIYTFWPPATERIRRYQPGMKLIVSLRDPVARAYSQWRMQVVRGMESATFSEAISEEGRSRDLLGAEFPGHHRRYSYVERGFYAPQLRRLLQHFPREQLHFVSRADLRLRHQETLDRICTFLDVPPFKAYPDSRLIYSFAAQAPAPLDPADATYLRELFRTDIAETEALAGCHIEREV